MARIDDPDLPDDDLSADDALSWEGDEELGRFTSLNDGSPRGGSTSPLVEPVETRGSGSPSVEPVETRQRSVPRTLITLLAGLLFLAWTVGWVVAIQSLGGIIGASTGAVWLDLAQRIGQFFALVSCPLWFAATMQFTQRSRLAVRTGWLALGLGLLVPWPFLIGTLA